MYEKDLKKPGLSCVEDKGVIHGFDLFLRMEEVFEILMCLSRMIQEFVL